MTIAHNGSKGSGNTPKGTVGRLTLSKAKGFRGVTGPSPYVQASTAKSTGHLSHFASCPGRYGAADMTYTALFAKYGMSAALNLYRGTNGEWYADPANVPGAVACP